MNNEKAYQEALERAKNLHKDAIDMDENIRVKLCEIIFPELNESEDEKIRKWLIDTIKSVPNDSIEWDVINKSDVLAWLEKQGEQKSTDTCDSSTINGKEFPASEKRDFGYFIKSKFHEGDWVILTAGELSTILQIVKVATNKKLYWFDDSSYLPIVDEECLRLWSIQDAKDGDVLQLGEVTAIFQEYIGNGHCKCYCSAYDGEFEIPSKDGPDNSYGCHNAIPATKEQRDFLFKKMKEAGYQWDADKKELNKIHVIDEGKAEMDYCFTKMMNGEKVSSAWSEKDEEMRLTVLQDLQNIKESYPNVNVEPEFNWLKSIKDRAQPQYLTITDEELVQAKKEAYNDALDKIEYHSGEPTFDDGWSAAIWYLKKKNGQMKMK